ncbi:MAG: ammonia-forming cytochrome c nitrite reductase subunit c552 [Candidatus Methanoperedens sp.]
MRKGILIGIGILIILLALAGTGSARPSYSSNCGQGGCHTANGSFNGTIYANIHKFDGISAPTTTLVSCGYCHIQPPSGAPNPYNMSLTSNGSSYNGTHRYNATTLASVILAAPACFNCHDNVTNNSFTRLSDTPTYLNSTTCSNCHKAKYDNWTNTMHRVMLTNNTTAVAMNLPTPEIGWANISYVIVSKFAFVYFNLTGYAPAQNDTYETDTKEFINYRAGKPYGTCGSCHTTGWNTSGWSNITLNGTLPGINGTFVEPGIGCERCHQPAGNGHQVVVNYSSNLCIECHTGSSHVTGWASGSHGTPLNASTNSCSLSCHSPFDSYKNLTVTSSSATNVACGVCHNVHNMTDSKYAETFSNGNYDNETWANISDAKFSYFNATASRDAGTDIFETLLSGLLFAGSDSRKDTTYGNSAINVTGPESEVLCSMCHYKHGLAQIAGANLTHSRNTTAQSSWATCIDCHMQGANASVGRDMMKLHANDPFADVNKSCGSATTCHSTSSQNLSASNLSIVPIQREWKATAHNDKETSINKSSNSSFYLNGTSGTAKSRYNSCLKCHSPFDWNPATDSNTTNVQLSSDFKGIVCNVCHNIHDMGDWINETGKVYGWYNRDAINNSGVYQANYTAMDNTTELCGNCHSNIRIGNTGPGWASSTSTTPIKPHGYPAKDVFVGSWKQTSDLNFECIDCHMYRNKTNATGSLLNDSEKITGHSFAVNESGLQNTTRCSGCHDGTNYGTIASVIGQIQTDTQAKWNTTNAIVLGALARYNLYPGTKNVSADKIAQAYWNLKLVDSDESWGVHDPVEANLLLDNAVTLAESSNASLGQLVSTVNLTAGWNLKALQNASSDTSPVSVMSSVASNITVVWGYNTSNPSDPWELYDPAMPTSLNDLTEIVSGEGYWIYAIRDCVWTV